MRGDRTRRRLSTLIAALVLIPCLALFAGGAKEGPGPGKKLRIAVSLPPATTAWQAKLLESVNAEAAKDTTVFDIVVKSALDDEDQLNEMTTFKAGGYDMILCLPGNGTLLTPICRDIFKSGTRLFIIDRPINGDQFTAFYGGDNAQCGRSAATFIGDRLKGKGQIAILRSFVGIPMDLQRYQGFMEVLHRDYPGITVLAEGDGEFSQQAGLKAMSEILRAYPHIDAVFSQDDDSAVGALTAIQNARRTDIQFVTGIGGARSAFKLMKEKNPLFGASMSYPPGTGGRALAMAKQILQGRTFPKNTIEPTVVVTPDNVGQYFNDGY